MPPGYHAPAVLQVFIQLKAVQLRAQHARSALQATSGISQHALLVTPATTRTPLVYFFVRNVALVPSVPGLVP